MKKLNYLLLVAVTLILFTISCKKEDILGTDQNIEYVKMKSSSEFRLNEFGVWVLEYEFECNEDVIEFISVEYSHKYYYKETYCLKEFSDSFIGNIARNEKIEYSGNAFFDKTETSWGESYPEEDNFLETKEVGKNYNLKLNIKYKIKSGETKSETFILYYQIPDFDDNYSFSFKKSGNDLIAQADIMDSNKYYCDYKVEDANNSFVASGTWHPCANDLQKIIADLGGISNYPLIINRKTKIVDPDDGRYKYSDETTSIN